MRRALAGLMMAWPMALGLAACSTPPKPEAPAVSAQRNIAAAPSFGCEDGTVFTAVFYVGGESVELRFPDGSTSTLLAVPAASGAKFENDAHMFWNKGEEALYGARLRAQTVCRIAK